MVREISLKAEGFEGRDLKVVDQGAFKGVKLMIDGKERAGQTGKYILKDNSGREVQARFNLGFLVDPYQYVVIEHQKFNIRDPLPWYQYAVCCWPILLIFVAGLLGGVIGFTVSFINVNFFRTSLNIFLKYILVVLLSLVSALFLLILAILINMRFG